jgi:hypothetical protein
MSQIFRAKKRYAKKSLAERIKNLNSVSKTHVQQDSSGSKGTLPMTDDNICTPPTSTFALSDSSNMWVSNFLPFYEHTIPRQTHLNKYTGFIFENAIKLAV